MTKTSPFVFDASYENFNSLVLGNSMRGPVLVNYWAAKAAPCFLLMPRLVKLCAEYRGKFLLVMFNTDELGRLARDQGITSVPTVKVYFKEKIVQTVHGAQSDTEFRKVIDRYVARESDSLRVAAAEAYFQGKTDQAFALFEKGETDDPDNFRITIDHAKVLVVEEQYAEAGVLLAVLPDTAQELPEVINLRAHLKFVEIAQAAPDPDTLSAELIAHPENNMARYQFSALKLLSGDTEEALEQLLEIIRRDPRFDNDAARKNILAIFNMLGHEDEIVQRYRARLSEALSGLH